MSTVTPIDDTRYHTISDVRYKWLLEGFSTIHHDQQQNNPSDDLLLTMPSMEPNTTNFLDTSVQQTPTISPVQECHSQNDTTQLII